MRRDWSSSRRMRKLATAAIAGIAAVISSRTGWAPRSSPPTRLKWVYVLKHHRHVVIAWFKPAGPLLWVRH
jgi:hypothetical protein